MLNLKVPIGERIYFAQRQPGSQALVELGSVLLDAQHGGKVELAIDLPAEIEVERQAAREARRRREQAMRPAALRRPAGERSRAADYEEAATVYCHLFENGAYVKTAASKLDGRLTNEEADQRGRDWQKTSKSGRHRGYVINDQPKPV